MTNIGFAGRTMRWTFYLALSMLLLGPTSAVLGQDQEQQPVLPDLAPREVEIRGQLQIAFPSLQRQPLVGFNPPPRVPEIPLSRRPITEDYRKAGAKFLRADLNPPEPPGVTALTGEGPLWAEAELSAGRYFQRRIHALGAARLRSNQKVKLQLRYLGTDGDNVGFQSGANKSDNFDGAISYQRPFGQANFGVDVTGFVSGFNLYGLDTTDTNGRIAINPDRTARSATESIWIASSSRSDVSYRVRAGLQQTKVESDLFATSTITDPSTERSERRVALEGRVAFPISSVRGFLEGQFEGAGLDAGGVAGSDVRHGEIAAGLAYQSSALTVEAAPAILAISFDGDVGGQPGETRTATYLSPRFDVSLRTGERVMFYLRNQPNVRPNSLADLFTQNPYLVNEPVVQPSINTIDAESGIALFSGPLQIMTEARVQRSPNFRYFVASSGSGASSVSSGFFDLGYGDGQIISIGGEVSLSLPAALQLSVAAYYHDSELTDLDVRIPHEPKISGRAGLSYPFSAGRGLVQLTGRYIGSRFADVDESIELNPYIDVDLYSRYNVTKSVGIVLRLDNISSGDHEIWRNYEESRFILSGGVRLLW